MSVRSWEAGGRERSRVYDDVKKTTTNFVVWFLVLASNRLECQSAAHLPCRLVKGTYIEIMLRGLAFLTTGKPAGGLSVTLSLCLCPCLSHRPSRSAYGC